MTASSVRSRAGSAGSVQFSIITACLNRRSLIGDAIESVLAQGYPGFEHIIVDGGSTDGTLELLAAYPHLQVVSEPDDGIYDAWNKGLTRCGGDVVCILNSDDVLAPGVLSKVAGEFAWDPALELVTGDALQFVDDGVEAWRIIKEYREDPGQELDAQRLIFWGPVINARFFRVSLFDKVGRFDTRYAIASDCDFMFRLARERPRCRYLECFVYYYRSHPGSTSLNLEGTSHRRSYGEKLSIAEEWMACSELTVPDRDTLRRRHSELSAIAFLDFSLRGDLAVAWEFFARGRHWPVGFLTALVREIVRIARYQLCKPFSTGGARFIEPWIRSNVPGRANQSGDVRRGSAGCG